MIAQEPGSNALYIIYCGTGGGVILRRRAAGADGGWADELPLGGTPDSDISAAMVPGSEILQLFYRAVSGNVMTMWRNPDPSWTSEQLVGGVGDSQDVVDGGTGDALYGHLAIGNITAARIPGSQVLGVFYRGIDSSPIGNFRPPDGNWTGPLVQDGDLATDITVVPVPQGPAPAPSPLGSNSNYLLYSPTALEGVTVTIEVTEDIVSSLGCGFQFNAHSTPTPPCAFQQYVIAMMNTTQITAKFQNWLATTPPGQPSLVDINLNLCSLVTLNVIPAGYRFQFELVTDASANISGVGLMVVDDEGTVQYNNVTPLPQAHLAPILAFELDFVASTTGEPGTPLASGTTVLTSGAGTITYAASTPMSPLNSLPSTVAAADAGTKEQANSVYGLLSSGPDYTFSQSFSVG